MEINEDSLRALLLCSFRYALGRKTYIVGMVAQAMRDNLYLLEPHFRAIVTEIEKAFEIGRAGMECDVQEWIRVRNAIEQYSK